MKGYKKNKTISLIFYKIMKSIFEKIIDGEIPSLKVYEDEMLIAILDINPKQQGHTILIPKSKRENIFEEDKLTRTSLIEKGIEIGNQLKDKLNATGIKLQFNSGKSAGQEVFHTHLHIIPTYDEKTKAINNEEILKRIKY